MDKAKLTGTSSILLVSDIDKSAEWYREKLGFDFQNFYGDPHEFCVMNRDNIYLMISQSHKTEDIKPNWKSKDKTSNVYFWVNDAEKIYREFIVRGAKIDYSLYVTDYNIKEFGVSDPDGYDISFGEKLI
ncbi:MAG TPA: VOC family protein [Ignavibacteria bacterium]|nr:VOC family protein [Ignavibacteria bacterium]HQY52035.1 VOC family protein [Ignavibacteria bacterium]HRA99557.1 VOC family protein [Ignavibacteria bacterium]